MVMQGGVTYSARFALPGFCPSVCYSVGEVATNVEGTIVLEPAELDLAEGPFTVTMALSTTNFLLVLLHTLRFR